jgi:peptidoglycan/xylan/chitin deacetylase (PgdA/CDA1 family)
MRGPVTVQASSVAALASAAAFLLASPSLAEGCHAPQETALGVSRVINIDTSGGPIFGKIKRYAGEPGFLGPREVVLTFDDGPAPSITRKILKTLRAYCAKATFFPVGRMAIAYPEVVREVARAGHTIGSHTWSHPLNLRRLRSDAATYQVEKGFAAVAMAAGAPIAPFFRFPGLNDDGSVLKRLQKRGIATFSVDVVTNDSFETDVDHLVEQTVRRVIHGNGGIVLFHDIKMTTAHALPRILAQLKKRGFRLVHLTSKNAFKPVGRYDAELRKKFARATKGRPLPEAPLRAPLHPVGAFAIVHPPVTELSPEAKTIKKLDADRKRKEQPTRKTPARRGWGAVVAKERSKTERP